MSNIRSSRILFPRNNWQKLRTELLYGYSSSVPESGRRKNHRRIPYAFWLLLKGSSTITFKGRDYSASSGMIMQPVRGYRGDNNRLSVLKEGRKQQKSSSKHQKAPRANKSGLLTVVGHEKGISLDEMGYRAVNKMLQNTLWRRVLLVRCNLLHINNI